MFFNWREKEVPWTMYGLVIVMAVFVFLRLHYVLPRFSDGSVYLYLGYLIDYGLVPYQDFFYSSPPLIPYLFSWLGQWFGFSWQLLGHLPLWLSLVDTVLIYWLVAKKGSHLGALAGAVLYLLSFTVLATTDFASDVHVVLTLVLLGAAAGQNKWSMVSGAIFGLAVMAKLYAVVLLVGWIMGYLWDFRWREAIKFLTGSLLVILIGGGMFWWRFGDVFYEQVILSHAGEVNGLSRKAILMFFIRHDWVLVFVPAAWLAVRSKVPGWIIWPVVALVGWLTGWSDFYYLYLKILAAWLAIWWGWIISQLYAHERQKEFIYSVITGLLIISSITIGRYTNEQARMAEINSLREVVDYVETHTGEDDVIYGSFEITPLIALAAERNVWRNMVDTNIKFFQNGWFNMEQRVEAIKQDRVRVIITKAMFVKGGRLARGPEQVLPRKFFNENCQVGKSWSVERDYDSNAVVVWLCNY